MRAVLILVAVLALSSLGEATPMAAQTASAEALPFKIDLPEGFETRARPDLPHDFDVYDVTKGDTGYVGIYVGSHASFPIKTGVRIGARRGGLKVAQRNGRVVEYLWTLEGEMPFQLHVWVREEAGVDATLADRIAASVRPMP